MPGISATVTVNGSVIGGSSVMGSGEVGGISLGTVTIKHNIVGGNATAGEVNYAGIISSQGHIGSVSIGGSIIAGLAGSGAVVFQCGAIVATKDIGSVTAKGSLIGNSNGTNGTSAMIVAVGQAVQGATTDLAIGFHCDCRSRGIREHSGGL
ncbi:MAG TPA: hypothetical protein VGN88_07335 [Phycisphaerae bacterium]